VPPTPSRRPRGAPRSPLRGRPRGKGKKNKNKNNFFFCAGNPAERREVTENKQKT
jgi:hypothetical protein